MDKNLRILTLCFTDDVSIALVVTEERINGKLSQLAKKWRISNVDKFLALDYRNKNLREEEKWKQKKKKRVLDITWGH